MNVLVSSAEPLILGLSALFTLFQVDNLIDLYLHMEEKHGKFLALIDLATLATKFKIDV
jgi:hypothetical protein